MCVLQNTSLSYFVQYEAASIGHGSHRAISGTMMDTPAWTSGRWPFNLAASDLT